MKISFAIFALLVAQLLQGQTLRNFKTKNETNITERTYMLDLIRAEVRATINQEVVFVVNHFMVSGNYAWFEGEAQLKNGAKPKIPTDMMECCHVEALYKRSNGKWVLKDYGTFRTDVWYQCLADQYPGIDARIFPPYLKQSVFCN